MTEKELINRVKVFQGNCLLNGDKISFGDCCKVILLSELIARGRELSASEMQLVLKLIRDGKAWYRFW